MLASMIFIAALNLGIAASSGPHFINEYTLPLGAYPQYIVSGPDGALWFSTYPRVADHQAIDLGIGRITTSGSYSFFLFELGTYDLATGSDGNIWFTNAYQNPYSVGRLTPQGVFTQFDVPSDGTPENITTGRGGVLWYTAFGAYRDVIKMNTSGNAVAAYHTPHRYAVALGAGPFGDMWFNVLGNPSFVGHIDGHGGIVEHRMPPPPYIPGHMVHGPDGRLWMCDGGYIAAITSDFRVTLYKMPGSNGGSADITVGPDGNLWVTDFVNSAIVRVTTGGKMTSFQTPTPNMFPAGITTGPDRNIWFTEIQNQTDVSKIGVLAPK